MAIREFITECIRENAATLIAWDAPLSFAPTDLSDRTVDKVVRAWAQSYVNRRRFAEKAVSVRIFSGLPHWVVSCASLGFPFGTPPSGLQLADAAPGTSEPRPLVVEVHPAVAIGAWWLASACPDPLPRYKGDARACARVAAELDFPPTSGKDDDTLDSFVAYRLGELFIQGDARWLGSARTGGYVMPSCAATSELETLLSRRGDAASRRKDVRTGGQRPWASFRRR